MQGYRSVRCAMLSVFDKSGIVEFAQALSERGVELLSTGGTARFLAAEGLSVIEISDYTGFPEIMGGRVKTLHPKVHGGILGRRNQDEDVMEQHQISPIDMVVVNLYPFIQSVEDKGCSLEDAVENIDIGGQTMMRSAAKNYKDVAIVIKSSDYNAIINEMDLNQGALTSDTRFLLAIKAFKYSASYDKVIAHYLDSLVSSDHYDHYHYDERKDYSGRFPPTLNLHFIKKQDIRYGENSHQRASFYIEETVKEASIATAQQIQGKTLSYNNIADADAALECVKAFSDPACVIVKHTSPCGVAISTSILEAYYRAYKTDPSSAFGGIIAFTRELDSKTAQAIISRQFVEVIIAPSVSEEALKIIANKKNVRVLVFSPWKGHVPSLDFKRVNGGLLVQDRDLGMVTEADLHIVTKRQPTEQERCDAIFSWRVAKFVKSNAIVYAKENMTIGIGAGQMNRLYSAKIAGIRANDEGLDIKGAAMASDAFFPFRDSIDMAASLGITCVIQPGGSIRDNEIIAAADEHGIAMIFTNMRHLRH